MRESAGIVYFWTSDNPFGNYPALVRTLDGAPKEEILTRAYGIPTRTIANRFPGFKEKIHCFNGISDMPRLGTRYMFVDPASSRNWFMLWVMVDAHGRYWVYREWPCEGQYIPDAGDPGPWAEADGRKADGKPGSAQTSFGWGIHRYLEEIRRLEGDEEIVERWMDSRFGNTPTNAADQATTLLEQCAMHGMPFSPSPGETQDEGISLINSLLDHERAGQPEPMLYINRECKALIFALKVFTGLDGKYSACKDGLDCLRWAACAGLQDLEGDIQLALPAAY
jgi:hypothetical protein